MNKLTSDKLMTKSELAQVDEFIKIPRTRNQLIIGVIRHTGCRPKEALNLRGCDLNLEERTVLIHGLKNSDDREIPLPKRFFAELYAHSLEHPNNLFPIQYRQLAQIWVDAGLPKTMKALRHTFATNIYHKTKDLRLTQIALGHKAIKNTLVYAHYIDSKDGLRKALLHDEDDKAVCAESREGAENSNSNGVGASKPQNDWQ